jgi:HEAT repeat protein
MDMPDVRSDDFSAIRDRSVANECDLCDAVPEIDGDYLRHVSSSVHQQEYTVLNEDNSPYVEAGGSENLLSGFFGIVSYQRLIDIYTAGFMTALFANIPLRCAIMVLAATVFTRCASVPPRQIGPERIELSTSRMSALLDSASFGMPEHRATVTDTLRRGSDDRLAALALANLRSDDPSVRHGTLRLLTAHVFPGLDGIATGFADSSSYVRWAAVRIAGAQRLHTASDDLVPLAADSNVGVRRAVAQYYGQLGDTTAIPVIRTLSTDPAEEVRAAAAMALSQLGPHALPELRHMVEQDSGLALSAALEAVGNIRSDVSTSLLTVAILDGTVPVRATACHALGRQRSSAADSILFAVSTDDPHPLVREAAAIALGSSNPALLATLVTRRIGEEQDVFVRLAWVYGLNPDTPQNRELLRELSDRDPSPDVRAAAFTKARSLQR